MAPHLAMRTHRGRERPGPRFLRPAKPMPVCENYPRRIDLEGKCVEMALLEGLVDLNAPGA